jgi:hypothetical protein
MVEKWITPEMVANSVMQNGIRLTKEDAVKILESIDQHALYAKHEPRIAVEVWKGQPINGVDVTNHPGGRITLDRNDPVTVALKYVMDEANKRFRTLGQPEIVLPDLYVPNAPRNTSHQFLTNDKGLAYMIYIDGKLNGFQPHVPGIQGYHALTSKRIQCHKGHYHDKCVACGQEHDIEKIMAEHRDSIIRNHATSEAFTKVLYLAQEIYDRRMETLDKLSAMS